MRLRKPHPCGGFDWQVTRLGADIGLRCLKCNRRVLLERAVLEKRLKQRVEMAEDPQSLSEAAPVAPAAESKRRPGVATGHKP